MKWRSVKPKPFAVRGMITVLGPCESCCINNVWFISEIKWQITKNASLYGVISFCQFSINFMTSLLITPSLFHFSLKTCLLCKSFWYSLFILPVRQASEILWFSVLLNNVWSWLHVVSKLALNQTESTKPAHEMPTYLICQQYTESSYRYFILQLCTTSYMSENHE